MKPLVSKLSSLLNKPPPTIIAPRDITINLNENCQIPASFDYGTPTLINGTCDDNPTVSAENVEECIGTQMSQNISARPAGHFIPIVVSGYDGLNASELEKITLSFSVNQGKGKAEFRLIAPDGSEVTLVGAQCSGGNCEVQGNLTYTPTFYPAGHLVWNNSDPIPAGTGNFIPHIGSFTNLTGPMNGTWYIYGTKTNGPGNVTFESACLTIATTCSSNQNLIRVWTVTDNCGNTNQAFQNVTVIDNTAPIAPASPADITVNCPGDIPTATSLTATDNCSGQITVNPTDEFMGSLDDCNGQAIMIKRSWVFTDACGNESESVQMITVNAVMNPTFNEAELPEDITVNCNEIPDKTMLTVNDNCGRTLSVMCTKEEDLENTTCSKRLIRRWSAQDCAGNQVSHMQTITIQPGTLLNSFTCPQVTYSYNNALALTLSDFNDINIDNGESGYCTVNYIGRATALDLSKFTCSVGGTVVVTYRFTSPC
ncbi:MAG: hypothetical protein IPO48_06365 [Saprospiraceae bacterium]|nr:hypothetical protein [Saprospiraceae bacterium]